MKVKAPIWLGIFGTVTFAMFLVLALPGMPSRPGGLFAQAVQPPWYCVNAWNGGSAQNPSHQPICTDAAICTSRTLDPVGASDAPSGTSGSAGGWNLQGQTLPGMQPPPGGQTPPGMQPPPGGQTLPGMQPPPGGQTLPGMQPPPGGQTPLGYRVGGCGNTKTSSSIQPPFQSPPKFAYKYLVPIRGFSASALQQGFGTLTECVKVCPCLTKGQMIMMSRHIAQINAQLNWYKTTADNKAKQGQYQVSAQQISQMYERFATELGRTSSKSVADIFTCVGLSQTERGHMVQLGHLVETWKKTKTANDAAQELVSGFLSLYSSYANLHTDLMSRMQNNELSYER